MIGILGGTFDPIHNGHLHIALRVREQLLPEQVQLMPCATPVHRASPCVSATHRRAMIELAIAGRDGLVLNPIELERDGPSYSVDSLRALRHEHDGPLFLILGSDAFNGFADWKAPQEILGLAHLVVCLRPGQAPDPGLFRQHRVERPQALVERDAGAILLLHIDPDPCSSTLVRAALASGETPADCLHPDVAAYIEQHHLYRKPHD